jgi:hypothetical protein
MEDCLPTLLANRGIEHFDLLALNSAYVATFDDITLAPNSAFEQLKTFVFEAKGTDFAVMSTLAVNILLGAPNMESFAFCYSLHPGFRLPFWDDLPDSAIRTLSVMPLRSLTLFGPVRLDREQ